VVEDDDEIQIQLFEERANCTDGDLYAVQAANIPLVITKKARKLLPASIRQTPLTYWRLGHHRRSTWIHHRRWCLFRIRHVLPDPGPTALHITILKVNPGMPSTGPDISIGPHCCLRVERSDLKHAVCLYSRRWKPFGSTNTAVLLVLSHEMAVPSRVDEHGTEVSA
jgi:hypothetical protein